jgi:tetratricopeptide (TPR) repeat protein
MAEIFISYSRKDSEFARRLSNELHKRSRDVWIDWEDIPRGADWLNEIYASIEAADTFVVIVSQHSLTSEICHYEIAHAYKFNKRVIPLIRQPIEGDVAKIVKGTWVGESWEQIARENWETIEHINWLHFADEAIFQSEFEALLNSLDEDLPHLKAHTRYLVRALDWDRAARNPSFLLMGDEIAAAETWLEAGRSKKPRPDPLHGKYIAESRRADDERKAEAVATEQRIAALRRRTRQFSIASVTLAAMVALAIIAVVVATAQGNEARDQVAVAQRDLATATLVQIQAGTAQRELNNANATLAPVETQVAQINTQAATAQTQAAVFGATLTPMPPMLTAAAVQIEAANLQRNISSFMSEGLVRISEGVPREASRIASNLALTYPDEPEAHFGSGLLFIAVGDIDAAMTNYTRAIELDPDYALAYNNRGDVHNRLGEYQQAIEDYSHAIELDPDHEFAYYSRGVAYGNLGDADDNPDNYRLAIEDYSHAIELNPDFTLARLSPHDGRGQGTTCRFGALR